MICAGCLPDLIMEAPENDMRRVPSRLGYGSSRKMICTGCSSLGISFFGFHFSSELAGVIPANSATGTRKGEACRRLKAKLDLLTRRKRRGARSCATPIRRAKVYHVPPALSRSSSAGTGPAKRHAPTYYLNSTNTSGLHIQRRPHPFQLMRPPQFRIRRSHIIQPCQLVEERFHFARRIEGE